MTSEEGQEGKMRAEGSERRGEMDDWVAARRKDADPHSSKEYTRSIQLKENLVSITAKKPQYGVVLLNIVVAILLDEFVSSVEEEKAEVRRQAELKIKAQMDEVKNPLEPLLETLRHFKSAQDLRDKILSLYQELNDGLYRLHFDPPIYLSVDDFENITENRSLCNAQGEIGEEDFLTIINHQLKQHIELCLSDSMAEASPVLSSIMSSIKLLMLSVDEIKTAKLEELRQNSSTGQRGAAAVMEVTRKQEGEVEMKENETVAEENGTESKENGAEGKGTEQGAEAEDLSSAMKIFVQKVKILNEVQGKSVELIESLHRHLDSFQDKLMARSVAMHTSKGKHGAASGRSKERSSHLEKGEEHNHSARTKRSVSPPDASTFRSLEPHPGVRNPIAGHDRVSRSAELAASTHRPQPRGRMRVDREGTPPSILSVLAGSRSPSLRADVVNASSRHGYNDEFIRSAIQDLGRASPPQERVTSQQKEQLIFGHQESREGYSTLVSQSSRSPALHPRLRMLTKEREGLRPHADPLHSPR
ncbi:hypothetical protein GUITHDRAFT_143271 [Guillardia theta CCMP2712]|uniref:Uncharacterized protein n=1 Tax=Guillardia theta (strain CCMP2712) TaxID=905079 RepID=L1ITT8_GUITC|nr:hypothetical protein GUITHDRAFT_143271 [Guillardia theta CCMP2712]EKX39681.1 hypothetical protein GUITHDRAFT_143271 [Guillardia theta CCMP2712]|eukprot:XP_005826661.1 hypothetical protein GUITHDRAFT_143271 [Guillardia theta CCMP2712]